MARLLCRLKEKLGTFINVTTNKGNEELMAFEESITSPEIERMKNLEFMFFITTVDLNLKDGSYIKKGTEFLVEKVLQNGLLELHFSMNEENYYKHECGDGYLCTFQQLQSFIEPDQYKIQRLALYLN
ncbi:MULTISPECIES: hypothetical protein [Desulfitobacterium]|uniref:Uncharacterized protein n=1 Tax=Desulfitobacterium chlororespirans DSM 11544 TaxID=1121395 RepID=A0A1M7UU24_9FIRM|nr:MULTISPECIES: hypothetical protein [Desulfitobacterium]SHN86448.1 hypothetical protein SAMN02745215_04630 [Desulfitobacterium chlororespirans DSM 11544]